MSLDDEEDNKTDEFTAKRPESRAGVGNKQSQNGIEHRDLAILTNKQRSSTNTDPIISAATPPRVMSPDSNSPFYPHTETTAKSTSLDYEAAVNALTLQFLNENEATRVAALSWLIMLQRKAPRKVCFEWCL